MRRFADIEFPENGFEAWGGYIQAKAAKLEEQFTSRVANEDQVSYIFKGISIYVNGYTKPSADELKTLMAQHGGVYHIYQRAEDFIIATNLPDTKVKNQSLGKVVKPEWITESILANKLLNYKDYLLYNQSRTQPKLGFVKTTKCEAVSSTISNNSENVTLDCIKDNLSLSINEIPIETIKIYPGTVTSQILHTGDGLNNTKKSPELTHTAADPNFISDFYNNSRLHHISQLGACFKQYINDLRDSSDFVFPARIQLKDYILNNGHLRATTNKPIFVGGKVIMHIDMDCFFVSVGLRNRPELRGRPIAVTHARTGQPRVNKRVGVDREAEFNLYRQRLAKSIHKVTGSTTNAIKIESRVDNITDEGEKYGSMSEIASCSYEARANGITNGMFMGAALKLCPDITAIPYDFEGYKEVAYTLYNTLAQYTLDIEAVSCDEMYVDCTDLIKSIQASVPNFASALREEIKTKTGCPCSAGFGGNRLQARLATKCAKPDGQYFLTADLLNDFMINIKLRDLPGVGRQTSQKLEILGHQTCGSLQEVTLPILQRHLGNKTGAQLYDQCRGIDSQPLNYVNIRKSVSAEVNYGIRFDNNDQCMQFLTQLSMEVHGRMLQFKTLGKCITLKLMVRAEEAPVETAKFMGHGFCNTINKSVTLAHPTNDLRVITKEVLELCKQLKIDPKEMRGIGIQITKLEALSSKNKTGAINKFLTAKDNNSNTEVKTREIKKETTPKKSIGKSPLKKGSPILVTKSPIKRKRKNLISKLQASTSVMSKFLQSNNEQIRLPSQVEIKPEIKMAEVVNKPVVARDSFGDLPWQTVREMLRAWVDTREPPLPYDVNFLATYLTEMVVYKRIDKVNILLSFFQRKTNELNCKEWSNVYENIVNQVQNAMIAVFGKRLLIN